MAFTPTSYADPASREGHLVEVVGPDGVASGSTTVADAHTLPGRLHRAFSVVVISEQGRILLQQRSAAKTRFALTWANTCCGHPGPGEDVRTAATTRLVQEMGLLVGELEEVGQFVYRAEDVVSGRVEHEYDHVLVARVPTEVVPDPDPAEVADWRWADPGELSAEMVSDPARYAPWLSEVARLACGEPVGQWRIAEPSRCIRSGRPG